MNEILSILGTALVLYGQGGRGLPITDRVNPCELPEQILELNHSRRKTSPVLKQPKQTNPILPTAQIQAEPNAISSNEQQLIAEILEALNVHRQVNGLTKLTLSPRLSEIAQLSSDLQKAENKVSHNGFKERLALIGNAEVGENVAGGYKTAKEVTAAWINSPGHNQNILNPKLIYVGIAVSKSANFNYFTALHSSIN